MNELEIELLRVRHSGTLVDLETGVGNFQQLDVQFTKLLGRWHRSEEPFSIALVGLASPNDDGSGLSRGSLVHLVKVLTGTARAEDTVCRVSKSEFAVLLANSTLDGAQAFLDRARNRIAQDAVHVGESSRFFRSAVGIAQWEESMGSLAGLLDQADDSMKKLQEEIATESLRYLGTA